MTTKITVLCNDLVNLDSKCIGEHGFSCFIEHNNKCYLFDTGSGLGVLNNSIELKKDLAKLSSIVISHGHWDHVDGFNQVLKVTGKIKVYAHPNIFAKRYNLENNKKSYIGCQFSKTYLEALGAEFVFKKDFTEIDEGIYMTGEVPKLTDFEGLLKDSFIIDPETNESIKDTLPDDNTMVLKTDIGLVVIFGCAHAGAVNIINYIEKKLPNERIVAILGGTHLHPADDNRVNKTIEKLREVNPEIIGTCHCTGLDKSVTLKNAFNDKFKFLGVGSVLKF